MVNLCMQNVKTGQQKLKKKKVLTVQPSKGCNTTGVREEDSALLSSCHPAFCGRIRFRHEKTTDQHLNWESVTCMSLVSWHRTQQHPTYLCKNLVPRLTGSSIILASSSLSPPTGKKNAKLNMDWECPCVFAFFACLPDTQKTTKVKKRLKRNFNAGQLGNRSKQILGQNNWKLKYASQDKTVWSSSTRCKLFGCNGNSAFQRIGRIPKYKSSFCPECEIPPAFFLYLYL